jgi:hypothetical protein
LIVQLLLVCSASASAFTPEEFAVCMEELKRAQTQIESKALQPLKSRVPSDQQAPLSFKDLPQDETEQKKVARFAYNYIWRYGNKHLRQATEACRKVDGATRVNRSTMMYRFRGPGPG